MELMSNTKEIYINFTFFNELKKHGLKNLSLAYDFLNQSY